MLQRERPEPSGRPVRRALRPEQVLRQGLQPSGPVLQEQQVSLREPSGQEPEPRPWGRGLRERRQASQLQQALRPVRPEQRLRQRALRQVSLS